MPLFSFLKTAVRDPIRVGAVMPSSSFAVRRILAQFPSDPKYVIDYGPVDGAITREVLKMLPAGGRLLAIETNGEFVEGLRQINDKRIILVQGDARRAARHQRADRCTFLPGQSGRPAGGSRLRLWAAAAAQGFHLRSVPGL